MAMKEATEAVIFVEKLGEQYKKAMANSKIDFDDTAHLFPLFSVGYDALKDLHLAAGEIKNANGEELQQFYVRASLATLNLMEAFIR